VWVEIDRLGFTEPSDSWGLYDDANRICWRVLREQFRELERRYSQLLSRNLTYSLFEVVAIRDVDFVEDKLSTVNIPQIVRLL